MSSCRLILSWTAIFLSLCWICSSGMVEEELNVLRPLVVDRAAAAKQYYEIGMSHARKNDYIKALSYLRGACRLDNSSALYWNDLGVTEMRLRDYHKAKQRFMRAIAIDASFPTATENLKDIQAYLSADDFENGLVVHRQQHQRLPFPQIELAALMKASYANDSILESPFIVKDAARMLGWDLHAISIGQLVKMYGQHRVDFYPHNMMQERVYPYFTSLADAMRQLLHYPEGIYEDIDVSQPGTYVQWNLEGHAWMSSLEGLGGELPAVLSDTHWIHQCLSSDELVNNFYLKTHWKMLLIGEAMSGMFNHKDSLRSSSWQIQLQGRKRWHVCSPREDRRLYKAGAVDAFHPNYKLYPRFRKVQECYETILEPGNLIYYPHDHWHQTMNLDTPSIAITGTIITSKNHRLVEEQLRRQCAGDASIFPKDEKLCPQLLQCYERWQKIYRDRREDEAEL
jgi:tetratricopeptide (TPR) repeat protein